MVSRLARLLRPDKSHVNAELRRKFNFFAALPDGHLLAARYLKSDKPYSYDRLGQESRSHLHQLASKGNSHALRIIADVHEIEQEANISDTGLKDSDLKEQLLQLVYYFAGLPNGRHAVKRAVNYAWKYGGGKLTPNILSDATRHSLYEDVLYDTSDSNIVV